MQQGIFSRKASFETVRYCQHFTHRRFCWFPKIEVTHSSPSPVCYLLLLETMHGCWKNKRCITWGMQRCLYALCVQKSHWSFCLVVLLKQSLVGIPNNYSRSYSNYCLFLLIGWPARRCHDFLSSVPFWRCLQCPNYNLQEVQWRRFKGSAYPKIWERNAS